MQSLNEPDLLFYSNSDQTTRDILDNNRLNNDQIQTNQKELPNIILIILESHTASRCNFLNPDLKESITPVLDDIAHNSINFRNCYANGTRSAYGLSSIYCSWPVIPGYPLNRQQQYKIKGQTTFGSIFKELGYQTAFMYGGDSEFDEMKNFVGCFLTGTAAEVTPVSQIGNYKFTVCNVIKDLSESYQALVRKKTAV